MAQHTLASSITTIFMAKVSILGVTIDSMKDTGAPIRCMVKACSPGLMDASTLANTVTIKRRVMVSSSGPMVGATVASGQMESKMEKVPTCPVVVKKNTANGKMVKE
jgi:hypothetical protein